MLQSGNLSQLGYATNMTRDVVDIVFWRAIAFMVAAAGTALVSVYAYRRFTTS